jgi:hypothetical protein
MSGIDDWFEEKTLLDMAPPDVFLRGASAAEHGSVQIVVHDADQLRTHVEDTEVLEAAFWLHDGELKWSRTPASISWPARWPPGPARRRT